jgi:alpha-tubulin suppressor-like RCC1 family protein
LISRSLVPLACLLALAGCGTLQVEIDNRAPAPAQTDILLPEYPPTFTFRPLPSATATPAPSATDIPPETPAATAKPPEVGVPLAAGRSHTCAVTDSFGVKCWGNNEHGQLGDGSFVNRSLPVDAAGLGTGVTALAAGWGHTCALTVAGGVLCWGYNQNGELGNGTTADSSVPVPVTGLGTGVFAIEAGDDHTCAILDTGEVECWGLNAYGQLGDGTKISRDRPVVAGSFPGGAVSVAAGWGHTCALTAAGMVKCWGNHEYGQLGTGQAGEYRLVPVDVAGLSGGALEITADGGSACARLSGGEVKCWGNNKYGQLGIGGTAEYAASPIPVGVPQGVTRIAAGWNHSCALTGAGELHCWGWNYFGQLGDGTKSTRPKPKRAADTIEGIAAVAPGWGHTCAADRTGAVACWGLNENGQLGDGTTADSSRPVSVYGLHSAPAGGSAGPAITVAPPATPAATAGILSFSAGASFNCVVMDDGSIKCWGFNKFGQLGDGTQTDRSRPVVVAGLTERMAAVEGGGWHTCALTAGGGVKCWGENKSGQLGDGTTTSRPTPVDVSGLSGGVIALAAGFSHTCALTDAGGVKCWGENQTGGIGDGTSQDRLTPVDVTGLGSGVVALTAGDEHTCALTVAGGVKCWGAHTESKGPYPSGNNMTPGDVPGLSSGVKALVTGSWYNCAVMDSGGVKCWGGNDFGQWGDGTTGGGYMPVDILGLPDSTVPWAAGYSHTCGLSASGVLRCWGHNERGQLGDGTRVNRSTPVVVRGLEGSVAALALGFVHTCALTAGGEIWCWGTNDHGELGNGTSTISYQPVRVIGF